MALNCFVLTRVIKCRWVGGHSTLHQSSFELISPSTLTCSETDLRQMEQSARCSSLITCSWDTTRYARVPRHKARVKNTARAEMPHANGTMLRIKTQISVIFFIVFKCLYAFKMVKKFRLAGALLSLILQISYALTQVLQFVIPRLTTQTTSFPSAKTIRIVVCSGFELIGQQQNCG